MCLSGNLIAHHIQFVNERNLSSSPKKLIFENFISAY